MIAFTFALYHDHVDPVPLVDLLKSEQVIQCKDRIG